MSENSTAQKSAGILFKKARAALGPELIAKLIGWAREKFQGAKAGNADAARSLETVTEKWTAPLKDPDGKFDPAKIEAAIAAFRNGPGEGEGPPAGEAKPAKRVVTKVRPTPGRER